MKTPQDEMTAPASSDLSGWAEAVHGQHFCHFRFEEIVAAIQDLGPTADKMVLNTLAKHLSDCMLNMLRGLVDRSNPNQGVDIIEDVHGQLWTALLQPDSPDGQGLRNAFQPRVRFRVLDALRRQTRSTKGNDTERTEDADCDEPAQRSRGEPPPPIEELAGDTPDIVEQVHIEDLLEMVPDYRKRLAFRLHMDGLPYKSTRGASIAETLDVSEKTARAWIKEVRNTLKLRLGDES